MIHQFFWRDPDNPARGWGLFAQVALSDANPNPLAGSGFVGLGGSTPFAGRLDDRWGVGWFKYVFSPALKVSATATGAGLNHESGLEAYYDAKIADHIRFGPDAQLIWPGTPGKSTALFYWRARKNRFLTFNGRRRERRDGSGTRRAGSQAQPASESRSGCREPEDIPRPRLEVGSRSSPAVKPPRSQVGEMVGWPEPTMSDAHCRNTPMPLLRARDSVSGRATRSHVLANRSYAPGSSRVAIGCTRRRHPRKFGPIDDFPSLPVVEKS
jgi:Carbohydrate-selective porin, OprB family